MENDVSLSEVATRQCTKSVHQSIKQSHPTEAKMGLSEIKDFLKVLDLPEGKLPTVAEYKRAFRVKLLNHPDKGGDTAEFQKITEAARIVFKYITDHPDQQTRTETDYNKDLLRAFGVSNNVDYNVGSVVFNIEGSQADLWIQCLRKTLGDPVALKNGLGVQMKIDDFKIPMVSCHNKVNYGSVSVTVWPNPANGQPKISVQGKMYLAYVSFVLPGVLKDMKSGYPLSLAPIDMDTLDIENEDEGDAVHEDLNKEVDRDNENMNKEVLELRGAFKRMENEVVTLRKDLVERVEKALANNTRQDIPVLEKRIDSLETLLRQTLDQNKTLSNSVDNLNVSLAAKGGEGNTTISNSQVHQIALGVVNHDMIQELSTALKSLRSEVAKTATGEDITKQLGVMSSVLNDIHTTTHSMEGSLNKWSESMAEVNKASAEEIQQLRKNSDNSLVVFESMKKSLETLVCSTAQSKASSTQAATEPSPTSTPTQTQEIRTKKGVIFTSSIALNLDVDKVKEELNCEIKVIPTYHIEHHSDAKDPDAYLQCMVNQHLAGKTGFDFAIIATGSNDITKLDTENTVATTLFKSVEEQSKLLVEIATKITVETNVDVFVIEKPPRYDPQTNDPSAMVQKLSKFSNGVVASAIGPTPRIFLVEQASLGRSSAKARADVYQKDGLHLTPKGLKIYTTNLISVMKECYGEAVRPNNTNGGVGGTGNAEQDRGVSDRKHQNRGGYRGDRQDHYWSGPPHRENRDWPPRQSDHHGYQAPPYTGYRGGDGGDRRGGGYRPDYRDYNDMGGFGGGYKKTSRRGYRY